MDTKNEVLQVDVGTDEKTYRDRADQWEHRIRDRGVQWEQRIRRRAVQDEKQTRELEARSRGMLLDIVKAQRCIMHPASVEILAVGWKLGPERVAIEAMARKGGKDRAKGMRFDGYCRPCGRREWNPERCGQRCCRVRVR